MKTLLLSAALLALPCAFLACNQDDTTGKTGAPDGSMTSANVYTVGVGMT